MASYKNIFKITHNDVLPIQGSILIAEPFLQDAYFQRSVVLLIEHTEHGSMGFVLNKKTDLIVNSFFKEFAEFPEIPIYLGGPVSPNRLFFIHSLGDNIIPDALKTRTLSLDERQDLAALLEKDFNVDASTIETQSISSTISGENCRMHR